MIVWTVLHEIPCLRILLQFIDTVQFDWQHNSILAWRLRTVCPIEKYTEQMQHRKLKHKFYAERILSVSLTLSGTINLMTSCCPHFVCEVVYVCVCVCVCVCVKCSCCWKYLCKIFHRDKFHIFLIFIKHTYCN